MGLCGRWIVSEVFAARRPTNSNLNPENSFNVITALVSDEVSRQVTLIALMYPGYSKVKNTHAVPIPAIAPC
jgi:hypothetical protein